MNNWAIRYRRNKILHHDLEPKEWVEWSAAYPNLIQVFCEYFRDWWKLEKINSRFLKMIGPQNGRGNLIEDLHVYWVLMLLIKKNIWFHSFININPASPVKKLKTANGTALLQQPKNTVAMLNELRQGLVYNLESQTGPVHAPIFSMSVEVCSKIVKQSISSIRHYEEWNALYKIGRWTKISWSRQKQKNRSHQSGRSGTTKFHSIQRWGRIDADDKDID